jgi:TRAP-type C4-dicarboxylate transport system permease small subunit
MNPIVLAVAGFALLVALAALRARLERHPRPRTFFHAAGIFEIGVIGLLLASLVVLGATQIFLRNVFHSGLLWAEPLMRHTVLWLGAMGAALAAARMHHITVDALSRVLPPRFKPARRVAVYGATSIVAYVLAIAALRLVVDERSFGEVAFLGIRTWVLQLILPVSFVVITYRTLLAIFLGREPAEAGAEV